MRNWLVKMDATTLEFPDNSFDRVLAAYFISTVPDPVRVIQEMKRVCRPGGFLVFLNHFHSDNPVMRLFEKLLSPLFYRVGFKTDLDLWDLMEAADWKSIGSRRSTFSAIGKPSAAATASKAGQCPTYAPPGFRCTRSSTPR